MITKLVIIGWTIFIIYAFFDGVVNVANLEPSGVGTEFDQNVRGFAVMMSMIWHFLLCAPSPYRHMSSAGYSESAHNQRLSMCQNPRHRSDSHMMSTGRLDPAAHAR
jgi:hypothetical protein